jgi:CubicO group peptidase (beta-lactamase class C family)
MATSLRDLEERIKALTPPNSTSPTIPGVILLATNSSPTTQPHVFSSGVASVSPDRDPPPSLAPTSTLWFASATKLLTSIAALQLIERNLWTLDRPVAEALPELGQLRELTNFNDAGEPIYAAGPPAGARITLLHLLTHTAGMAYDFLNPKLMQWWKAQSAAEGRDMRAEAAGSILQGYSHPLVRESGTGWEYSPSIDWVGALVAKLYGDEPGRVGKAIQREVLSKVGVDERDVVWRLADLSWDERETQERWADLTARTPDGKLAHVGPLPPENAKDDLGGAGIRMPAAAYFKVLESLIKNDGRLLKPGTVDQYVFTPQLTDDEGKLGFTLAQSMRTSFLKDPGGRMMSGGLPLPSEAGEKNDEYEYNHSLLGALSRRNGEEKWALHWGGAPNIQWFVDPGKGVAGLFAAQLLPPVDGLMLDLAVEFREAVVKELGKTAA